jgi:hypothetical protein
MSPGLRPSSIRRAVPTAAMTSCLSAFRSVLRTASRSLQCISQRPFVRLPVETPIDEETLPQYDPEQFYPVHVGDVFNGRYRVTGKLGYGAYSTSWLCRDLRCVAIDAKQSNLLTWLRSQRYLVLKVSTSLRKFPTATDREIRIYEHLAKVNSTHPGQSLIRELYDSFEPRGHTSNHRCLVLQPMHMTLLEMMKLNPRPFNLPLLKMTPKRLLLALDFLHTEAGIIHTGTAPLPYTAPDGKRAPDLK